MTTEGYLNTTCLRPKNRLENYHGDWSVKIILLWRSMFSGPGNIALWLTCLGFTVKLA